MANPRALSAFGLAALALAPMLVLAQAPQRVSLRFACVPSGVSSGAVVKIVRAHLAPIEVAVEPPPPASFNHVDVAIEGCEDDPPRARVSVERGAERVAIEIGLGDIDAALRDRSLALLVVEAVARPALAVSLPAAEPSQPAPARAAPAAKVPVAPVAGRTEPAQPPHSAAPVPAVHEHGVGPAVRGAVGARFVFETDAPVLAVDAGIAWRRLAVSLFALRTQRTTDLGTIELFALGAMLAADVWSPTDWLSARAALELGLSWASAVARPNAVAQDRLAPHAALAVGVAAVLPLDRAWTLELIVQGGYASSLIARAGGRDSIGLQGPFVAATLGVRFQDR